MSTTRRAARAAGPTANHAVERRIHSAVLDAILEYRLPPGVRLVEADLCALFGASRSAVRNALARLGERGLVQLRPNRGAVVAAPSLAESREIYGARRAVETAIVRSLARAPAAAMLRDLRGRLREEEDAYRAGNLRRALRLSEAFHRALARAAGNRTLEHFLENLLARTPLVVLTHADGRMPHYCGNAEHRAIVAAIARGDAQAAAQLIEQHLDHLESQLSAPAAPLALPSLREALRARGATSRAPGRRRPSARARSGTGIA